MAEVFTSPYMYWIAVNLGAAGEPEVEAFNRFYDEVHAPEVFGANDGFVALHRFQLVDPEPATEETPSLLQTWEVSGEDGMGAYLARNDGPAAGRPAYSSGPAVWENRTTIWRVMWKQLSSSGPATLTPRSVRLVGTTLPEGATAAEIDGFIDFWTNIHVLEASQGRHSRVTTYELVRQMTNDPDCPQYLAIFETADQDPAELGDPLPPAQRTEGPAVWQARTSTWRFSFDLMSSIP